jgi:hypothetical protein
VTPRRSLGALVLVAFAAAGCGAGRNTETDKERGTPYIAQASVGSVAVRAVRVVLSDTATSADASSTTPQAFLLATFINRGRNPDALTGATVSGSEVQPVGSTTPDFSLQPQQVVQIGNPELGFTGTSLGVGALSEPLVSGTTTPVTFTFASAGTVTVDVPVMTSSDVGATASAAPVTAAG